jgi:cytochrome P450
MQERIMKDSMLRRDHFNDFDMDSPEFNEEYEQVLEELPKCPVAHSKVGRGYHVVNRQEDVRTIAQDWQTFSNAEGMFPNRPEGMPFALPEEIDPPYQKNWRIALNKFWTAKRVAEYADSVREQVNFLIDGFIEKGSCDFYAEFASVLPGRVFFAILLHAPLDDLQRMIKVVDTALMGPVEERGLAWTEIHRYIEAYLKTRMDEPPRGDYIDAIIEGVPDATGEPCSWQDKVAVATLFLSGAVGTTAAAISGMVLHLARNPQDRAMLADNPDLHDSAVEEFIRLNSPVVAVSRTATRDGEIAGTSFKAGDRVCVNYAAASRDPEVYQNPAKFDPRRDQSQSAVFGMGPHRCIGSHLARLEVKLALEAVLSRMDDISVVPEVKITYTTGVVRVMNNLPIRFAPGQIGGPLDEISGF